MAGFDEALIAIKGGKRVRRLAWKGRAKWIERRPAQSDSMSYIELRYEDLDQQAPWTPTRCDLLEQDWVIWEPI